MKPPIVPSTTTRGRRPAPRTSRRRRPAAGPQYGQQPGSAAEELRKLFDAVADKVSSLQSPLLGMAAQGTVQQVIRQAKSAVEPVIERNPDLFDHLAAAGNELLAAYRSAVEGQEGRWTRGTEGAGGTSTGTGPPPAPAGRRPTTPRTRATRAPAAANHDRPAT